MYWMARIDQWSLVRNDEGWSCYEHDPQSAQLFGQGWGVLKHWQALPVTTYYGGWLGPELPPEVPAEIAGMLLASARASGHGGPVAKS